MKEIINVSTEVLKVHPRNTEFFDDISGTEYTQFKKSIEEDGILSPILVSPDMTVISGHQRLKACKDLGINLVPIIIKEDLIDENEKLKTLLVANFGRNKNDPIKQGKVYGEYEKLCGVQKGNNQYSLGNNSSSITQEDIAKQLGVDVTTIRNIKRLQQLPPELQELISNGKITATTGFKILTKLSSQEQEELISSLDITKKLTQKQVQEYVDKITKLNNEVDNLNDKLRDEKDEEKYLKKLENAEQRKEEIEKELSEKISNKIISEQQKKHEESLINYKNQIKSLENLLELYKKDSTDYSNLKGQIENLTKEKDDIGRKISAVTSISALVVTTENFLKTELSPIKYSRAILEVQDDEIVVKNLSSIIQCVENWCGEMRKYLPKENNYIIVEGE